MNIDDSLKKYLEINNEITITAKGNSMIPTIYSEDTVTVSNDINSLKDGDVILYYKRDKSKDIFIIHRILYSIKNKIFITKGDNNKDNDTPVRKKHIIGKVISIQHKVQKNMGGTYE